MTGKIKQIILFVGIFMVLTIGSTWISKGAETGNQTTDQVKQMETDIIFVVDFSNSMNGNDRDKIALQMLATCIDALYTSKVQVGFVAYNDRILSSSAPVSIVDKQTREALKAQINSVNRSGSTDIGLALAEAEGYILQHSIPAGREGRIILLSDGEPDLTYSKTGKNTQQSIDQMREVALRASQSGIAIDCIAFGQHFDGATTELASVAETSGGGMYVARTPEVLIDIFAKIIEKTTFSKLRPISVTIAGGEEQTVELPAKDMLADEANILVVSSQPLQDVTILYSGEEVTYSRSNHYFTAKIADMKNEDLIIKMIGSKDQEIKIYLVLYKDFQVHLETGEQADKNIPFSFQYYIKDLKTDQIIDDRNFYNQFTEKITLPEEEPLAVVAGDQLHDRTVTFDQSGDYQLGFEIYNDYYYVKLNDAKISVVNSPPKGRVDLKKHYLKSKGQRIFDLNEYFIDENDDILNFTIQYLEEPDERNIILQGNELFIDLDRNGRTSLIIQAVDSEGAVSEAEEVTITVEPFWIYYSEYIIGFIVVLLMALIYLLLVRKKRKIDSGVLVVPGQEPPEGLEINMAFNGKLNVYFIKVPDGLEVEPLTFALYQLKEKKVTLGHLLGILDLPLKSFDPEHIFFEGGMYKELTLSHSSNCSIMIGPSIICRKLKYSVEYGNKVYITSLNGEYELELHYLSIRS